mmetsp:Transcript_31193/g.74059  ORF Transcript_31193/g.74059 Transcript_31193/m.74059 type:complete len:413 (-) Transcript_31193:98-1336(-)
MFFIMFIPACIMSGDIEPIMSRPLPMSMLAMSMPPMPAMPAIGLAAAPAVTALLDAAPGCAELLPPPAAGGPMPPPMPGMPPPICWAILAMFFMSSGFMPDIILDIILIWLGSIPASCGAMALSWSGSMFSSISACLAICSGEIWSSIRSISAGLLGMPGIPIPGAPPPPRAAVTGARAGAGGVSTDSIPSLLSASLTNPATVASEGSMSRALLRSASASSCRSCLRRAWPRRKSALRLAPRSSTTSHSVATAAQSSSLSWQLARFKWQASLSSCTAFLSAPESTPFFSTRSTSVQPCLYCSEAALWSDPLNLVLPCALAPSASSTSSSSSSGTSMADAFNLASTVTGAAGAAAAADAGIWLRRDLRSSPLMFSIWFIACCAIAGLDIICCACCIIAGSMFLVICIMRSMSS